MHPNVLRPGCARLLARAGQVGHWALTCAQTRSQLSGGKMGFSQAWHLLSWSISQRRMCAASVIRPTTGLPITHLTHAEVVRKFKAYDLNGDGFVTIGEICAVVQQMGTNISNEQITEDLKLMDRNGDGEVNYHEFATFWLGRNRGGTTRDGEWMLTHLIKRFKALDLDGDGLLTPTELFIGLALEHPTFSPQQIRVIVNRMLRDVDKDHSGAIDFYEFTSQFLNDEASQQSILVSAESTIWGLKVSKVMRFIPHGREVLASGTKTKIFKTLHEAAPSPLATALFKLHGVHEVILSRQHVTIMKTADVQWDDLQEHVSLTISQFFESGLEVISSDECKDKHNQDSKQKSVEEKTVELLEDCVKPFMQQDGGDISFDHFDCSNGILYLRMRGPCFGSTKSDAMLLEGLKKLMFQYLPEVKQIVSLADEEEDPLFQESLEQSW